MVLECLGMLLKVSGALWWRFLAKMGPRWGQDGPSWQQVGPKMGHDSAKMTMLGSVWGPGSIFGHCFRDLCKNGRSVKTDNSATLFMFFGGWGLLWRVLEAVLGGFWELCWKMLAPMFFWISWEMLWHLRAKMAHRSAKTRQDRRT